MKDENAVSSKPEIVSAEEWERARAPLVAWEKSMTKTLDRMAAARRRLPWTKIEKNYVFEGEHGKASLADLFDGRRQLLLYHFMFAPGVHGWPDAGCPGCSFFADQVPHLAHVRARDANFVFVSRGPLEKLLAYKKRMGWAIPWFSSEKNDFNADLGLTTKEEERHGLSVFIKDEDGVYRTYFTTQRGLEYVGSVWALLDRTPLGRQEKWEDSPAYVPQTDPYLWWRRHDDYDDAGQRSQENGPPARTV